MFECAFWHLAPDNAGKSICVSPFLMGSAGAVIISCVLLVSVLSTPKIVTGAHGVSAMLVVSSIGLCIAASMAGCALHFVAPEDVGAGVCGQYLLSSAAAGML